jgi:hypothetical protein
MNNGLGDYIERYMTPTDIDRLGPFHGTIGVYIDDQSETLRSELILNDRVLRQSVDDTEIPAGKSFKYRDGYTGTAFDFKYSLN